MGHWTHGEINRLCLNRLDLCHDFETWSVNSVDPSFDFTMKAVIQRVINASVAGQYSPAYENSAEEVVDGQTISSIGKGLLVLVGIDKRMSTTVHPLLQEALALAFV
jgi:hypothetical protein